VCRIFGNISSKHGFLPSTTSFEQLTFLSKKGGPDSTQFFITDELQFGFNRLSILDTTERGNQPIISPSGRYVMMLNGEIYNFKDLTLAYNLSGLRSGSDAEVVAHLLDKITMEEIPGLLNGMFGISVWDIYKKELHLFRDFAGIKPLFYGQNINGLVFSSQFNQILLHPWFREWTWSDAGLREYLQFGFMTAPRTVASHVYQLLPGEWLRYNAETNMVTTGIYQRFFDSDKATLPETEPEQADRAISVLKKAVTRQLVSDVPLGIFLSGGVDSALMAAIASKVRPDVETLTIGFNQKIYDESTKAAEYARILGIKNQCIMFSDSELMKLFDEHNEALSEPFADYSSLPTYLVSKAAATRFKVMLSGDGGDELFWGYPRFRTFASSSAYFNIPTSFARRVTAKLLKPVGSDITGFLYAKSVGEANMHFHSYLHPSFLDKIWVGSIVSENTLLDYKFYGNHKTDTLLHLRQNEFYQHLQKILIKVDRMSMANALEVRVPLLDKEVLKFAETISPELCNSHNTLKYLLKKILGQYIPKEAIEQKKKGFTPPLKVWARTILHDQISDVLNTGLEINLPLSSKNELFEYGFSYLRGEHQNLEGMWTIYSLAQWHIQLKKTALTQ
jgi:asparagine synthase (glutamine-hydrolysing)